MEIASRFCSLTKLAREKEKKLTVKQQITVK